MIDTNIRNRVLFTFCLFPFLLDGKNNKTERNETMANYHDSFDYGPNRSFLNDQYHQQDEQQEYYYGSNYEHSMDEYERYLADKYAEEESLDYSVLSVGILTLGLILLVEVIRHQIDHSAHGRPFFQAVLENIYSELATLGIVELFVFILIKYYENINKARKEVFGDVHFCLFYTAIFNAFQSALVAMVTTRASTKQWVATEHLELDHYVEIREAFDQVEDEVCNAKFATKYNPFSNLRSKYVKLLIQVRFHELRLHFLEGNDLPLQLKVSDYLKRSELRLLIQLVHISATAWLLLTGGLNLIYFLMGMVAYTTGSGIVIGRFLSGIFFAMLLSFIVITVLLYFKMKSIFRDILSMKHLSRRGTGTTSSEDSQEEGLKRQESLFWFGKPKLVISIIQFMQFGYALALAIVIMYWDELTSISPFWYLGGVLACYSVFVYVLGLVIPQYTLCTSLGHMVNQKNLQETVALFRLEHEQKRLRRKKAAMHYNIDDNTTDLLMVDNTEEETITSPNSLVDSDDSPDKLHSTTANKTVDSNGSDDRIVYDRQHHNHSTDASSTTSSGDSHVGTGGGGEAMPTLRGTKDDRQLLAELVKMDTKSLRNFIPEESRQRLTTREEKVAANKQQRTKRLRQFSDGVSAMSRLGTLAWEKENDGVAATSSPNDGADGNNSKDGADTAATTPNKQDQRAKRLANRRASRKKAATASGVIQTWRAMPANGNDPKETSKTVLKSDDNKVQSVPVPPARENRRKSASASGLIQSWRGGERNTSEEEKTPEGETTSSSSGGAQSMLNRRKKSLSASSIVRSWRDHSADGTTVVAEQSDGIIAQSRSHDDMDTSTMSPTLVGPEDPGSNTAEAASAAAASQLDINSQEQEDRTNKNAAVDFSVSDLLDMKHNNPENDEEQTSPPKAPTQLPGDASGGFWTLSQEGDDKVDQQKSTETTTMPKKSAADDYKRAARVAERRRNRKKAISAPSTIETWQKLSTVEESGAEAMASLVDSVAASRRVLEDAPPPPSSPTPIRPNVAAVDLTVSDLLRRSSEGTAATDIVVTETESSDDQAARVARRRINRKKALSASGVIQAWQDHSLDACQEEGTLPRSLDDMDVFAGSTPIVISSTLEDLGSAQLVLHTSKPESSSQDDEPMIVDTTGIGFDGLDSSVPKKDYDDENSTVDTGKSVGELSDGISDVDIDEDFRLSTHRPAVNHDDENWKQKFWYHFTPEGFVKDMTDFFLGESYPTYSHVFGTLVVFFLIGERVEAMNAVTGVYDPSENTWELNLKTSFWWEFTCYLVFLLTDAAVLYLFGHGTKSPTERRLNIAAIIDIVLSGTCMTLLFVAERQRCCDSDLNEDRYLADETGFGSDFVEVYADSDSDCCGPLGTRTYGGLGNIEPFTSLIALRLLRFFVAGLMVKHFFAEPTKPKKSGDSSATEDEYASGDHLHKKHDSHGHGHDHDHGMRDDVGSALEVWEQAIGNYPEIVQEYGQFSSELFKTMLGLEIIDEPKQLSIQDGNEDNGACLLTEDHFKAAQQKEATRTIKLTAKQYTELPAEAQQIIIAGRLGVPVRCKSHPTGNGTDFELPTLTEDAEVHHSLEFEVDTDQLVEEEERYSMFLAPNARLVRSMRRCHRRLLPILNEWVTVDVAVTQFEIVYFEVHESEDPDESESLQNLRENGRLALQATKGGKGLRLCDVAGGRKVVGHFDLGDVTEVHVERDVPLTEEEREDNVSLDQERGTDMASEVASEFWCDTTNSKNEISASRNLRWSKTKEDRLQLKSVHGTLVLRFFSDLDEMEVHQEDHIPAKEGGSTLKKIVAYQWAQTIVHSCGPEQLVGQTLPHYGEGAGELEDYIELAHYHDEEAHKHRKKGHRRIGSHVNLGALASGTSPPIDSISKGVISRSVSLDAKTKGNPKTLRRSLSSPGGARKSSKSGSRSFNRSTSGGYSQNESAKPDVHETVGPRDSAEDPSEIV